MKVSAALTNGAPDLMFIDGMHLSEFTLRDFINVERWASPNTRVVIDDIFANHPVQAERRRATRVWTGEVWKLHHCLSMHRPDLLLLVLDAEPTDRPTGLLLVAVMSVTNSRL